MNARKQSDFSLYRRLKDSTLSFAHPEKYFGNPLSCLSRSYLRRHELFWSTLFFFFFIFSLSYKQLDRLPVVLSTTSRVHRELACSSQRDTGNAGSGGEEVFDPMAEAVKAARSCASVIKHVLSCRSCTLPETLELPTPAGKAAIALSMASSTAFGGAIREALVRSPSSDLRANAMALLENLASIDGVFAEAEGYSDGGGGMRVTTAIVSGTVAKGFSFRFCLLTRLKGIVGPNY